MTRRYVPGKKLLPGLLSGLLTVAMLLAGCAAPDRDDSLKKVLDAGELVLGLDENFPPMGYRDGSGEIVGFDIDLAKEVADRLGVRLVTKPIDWELKEQELNAGNIDCIWNGLSVLPARKESMNLSEPYMLNELVFVVSSDSGIKTLEELEGKKTGVQAGSSAEDALKTSEIFEKTETVTGNDNIKLLNELQNGTLAAVCLDSVFIYHYISENNCDLYVLPAILGTEDIAIGFRKHDNALRNKVQEILSDMKKDGTLSAISDKWFGTDVTTVR